MFGRKKVLIVEVERPRPIVELDEEMAGTIASLSHHPGFLYLLDKLRLDRSYLEATLLNRRQNSLDEVNFLKAGVAWSRWLEGQLERSVKFKRPAPQNPELTEQQMFDKLKEFVTVIGDEETTTSQS